MCIMKNKNMHLRIYNNQVAWTEETIYFFYYNQNTFYVFHKKQFSYKWHVHYLLIAINSPTLSEFNFLSATKLWLNTKIHHNKIHSKVLSNDGFEVFFLIPSNENFEDGFYYIICLYCIICELMINNNIWFLF